MDDEVQPIADAQHRQAQLKKFRVGGRGVGIVDRRRPAGEDEAERVQRLNFGDGRRAGQHHGEDILLANPPRDQLRILRTEIEDDDGLGGHPLVWQGASPVCKPNPDFSRCGFLGDFHSLELICKVLKIKKGGAIASQFHGFTVYGGRGGT